VESLNARALVVSYNSDGILAPEELAELLGDTGRHTVEILDGEYVKFRGGKGTQTALGTTELVYVVFRGRRQSAADRRRVLAQLGTVRAHREIRDASIIPDLWVRNGGRLDSTDEGIRLSDGDGNVLLVDSAFRVREIRAVGDESTLLSRMERARGDKPAICRALAERGHIDEAIDALRLLKIRKYRADFATLAAEIGALPLTDVQYERIEALKRRVLSEPGDRSRARR
jgi:hypothetical protein